jgi:replication initiation and membrane attachment protein DnaB
VEKKTIPILEMKDVIYSSVDKEKKIQSQTLMKLKEI